MTWVRTFLAQVESIYTRRRGSLTSIRIGRVFCTLPQSNSAAEINSPTASGVNSRVTSPASKRAISFVSPISRLIRSHSSSMTTNSSFRSCLLNSRSSSKLVADALMEVSGVLKSCVIASSRTDFSRSFSRTASATGRRPVRDPKSLASRGPNPRGVLLIGPPRGQEALCRILGYGR